MARKNNTPFQIGDKVVSKYDGSAGTVLWVSKGFTDRRDQLIATERNGYSHAYSDASTFVAQSEVRS